MSGLGSGKTPFRARDLRGDRGVALLLVIAATTLLGALAGVLVMLVMTEEAVESYQRRAIQARLAAEALLTVVVAEADDIEHWDARLLAHDPVRFTRPPSVVRLADGHEIALALPPRRSDEARSALATWRVFGGGWASALMGREVPGAPFVACWVDTGSGGRGGGTVPGGAGQRLQVRVAAFGPGGIRQAMEATLWRSGPGAVARVSRRLLH